MLLGVAAVILIVNALRDQVRVMYSGEITDAEYRHARASAERLVAALGEYHAAHSAYPPALADLVPEFMAEVPALTGPKPLWDYGAAEDGFWLSFWVGPMYETDSYRPSQGWYMDR